MGQKPTNKIKKDFQDTTLFLWWWLKAEMLPQWIAFLIIKLIHNVNGSIEKSDIYQTGTSRELTINDFFHLIPVIPDRPRFIAYHPALPTIQQIQEHVNQAISCYVPLQAEIHISNEKVRIITWNVLENDLENNFGRKNSAETYAQKMSRYQRIANSLAAFVENNAPVHFITLQHIDSYEKNGLFCDILEKLQCFGGVLTNPAIGVITLYNKKLYTHKNNERNQSGLNGAISVFERVDGYHTIEIFNVYAEGNAPVPVMHEKKIKLYLGKQQKNATKVVIGDFQCPIAPVETISQNLVTSVKSAFGDPMAQRAYANTGAFYQKFFMVDDTRGITIHQAQCTQLNPCTGLPFTENIIQTDKVKRGLQAYEILRYRPVISLDFTLQNEPWIAGKTLKLFEEAIQKEYGSDIYTRDARNLNNDRALALIMPSKYPLKNFIKIFFQGLPDFQPQLIEDNANMSAILCIPQKHITAFCHFIFSNELSDFLKKKRDIIPQIEKKFMTYNNPRFYTRRGVNPAVVNTFHEKIIDLLEQGKILRIFIALQDEFNSYSKNDPNKSGSYAKRLGEICKLLTQNFPEISQLAKPFCKFLKKHAELVHLYADKVQTLLIQGMGCSEEKYLQRINTFINQLSPAKENKPLINAIIESLETYQVNAINGIVLPAC